MNIRQKFTVAFLLGKIAAVRSRKNLKLQCHCTRHKDKEILSKKRSLHATTGLGKISSLWDSPDTTVSLDRRETLTDTMKR